jgi:hypothetical protein
MTKFLHFNNSSVAIFGATKAIRKQYQSRTVAAEVTKPDAIIRLAEAFLSTPSTDEVFGVINVGVTILSFKDRYNRKTGREEALKKMKLEKLKVISVLSTPTHIFVYFAPFKGVNLAVRSNKDTGYSTVVGELGSITSNLQCGHSQALVKGKR